MSRHTAKAPSQRQLRVGEEIRHVMADILGRGELRDPDLADVSITVTEARPSPDLKRATVYVMPLGGGDQGAVVDALNRAASFLRGRLGAQVALKFTPTLQFEVDRSFAEAERVDAILRSLDRDAETRPGAKPSGDQGSGGPDDGA